MSKSPHSLLPRIKVIPETVDKLKEDHADTNKNVCSSITTNEIESLKKRGFVHTQFMELRVLSNDFSLDQIKKIARGLAPSRAIEGYCIEYRDGDKHRTIVLHDLYYVELLSFSQLFLHYVRKCSTAIFGNLYFNRIIII